MMTKTVEISTVDWVVDEFARKHHLQIEDRNEFDAHNRQDFETSNFVPAFMIVKFYDRKRNSFIRVRFVYTPDED